MNTKTISIISKSVSTEIRVEDLKDLTWKEETVLQYFQNLLNMNLAPSINKMGYKQTQAITPAILREAASPYTAYEFARRISLSVEVPHRDNIKSLNRLLEKFTDYRHDETKRIIY